MTRLQFPSQAFRRRLITRLQSLGTILIGLYLQRLKKCLPEEKFSYSSSNWQRRSSWFKRLESQFSSEFVCFFDLQFFFTHPSVITFFFFFLVGFLSFLRLLRRLLRRLWSRLRFGSVTPTMGRSWTRARPRMATMRRTTSASVSASSMRGSTRYNKKNNVKLFKR